MDIPVAVGHAWHTSGALRLTTAHRCGSSLPRSCGRSTFQSLPAVFVVLLIRHRSRIGRSATHKDTKRLKEVGHATNIGPEGKKRLRASAQHLTPVAAAGATSFPSVPSAHRDGYAAPEDRGPRFNLLPPPPDRPYLAHQGVLQPALRSRLDVTKDSRLESSMGSVLPETVDTTCLVPEPHFRVLRPEQRQRSTAALAPTEEMTATLEREGRYFQPLSQKQEGDINFSTWSDDELRTRLKDCAELVSGSRAELMDRLMKKRLRDLRPWKVWTKKEVEAECLRLGLRVLERKADNVQKIEEAEVRNREAQLSDEDLYFELAFRQLPHGRTREENEQRLRAALRGFATRS